MMVVEFSAVLAEAWAEPPLIRFGGRLHPLLVHFPIGLITIACLAEFAAAMFKREGKPSRLALQCLGIGACFAVLAAGAGWINAAAEPQSAANADLLELHRWLGVATAGASVIAILIGLGARGGTSRFTTNAYRAVLMIGTACLGIGGHFGGELVYGKGYVFEVFNFGSEDAEGAEAPERTPEPDVVRTVSYATQVRPILESACWHCHGEARGKAGLRLHDIAGLFADDEEFWVVRPGDPDASLLVERIALPADHPDVMPPDDDPLSEESVALIRTWIAEGAWDDTSMESGGASEDQGTSDDDTSSADTSQEAAGDVEARAPVMEDALGLAPIDEAGRATIGAALQSLREFGVAASRVAATTHAVDVNFSVMSRPATNDDLARLSGLESSLVWLNLAGSSVDASGAATLAQFTELRRLHLEQSTIDDEGVAALATLPNLEYLNLYGTSVTDASLESVMAMPSLEQVYLWQTNVSAEAIEAARSARPELTIVAGDAVESDEGADESDDTAAAG